jgi:hypothetical protein
MMMRIIPLTRNLFRIVVAGIFLCGTLVAAQSVERLTLPAGGLSEPIRHAVDEKGYRIKLDNGWTADIWCAQQIVIMEKNVPGALYPDLEPGSFVGLLKLDQDTRDYRGQTVRAGTYTLRYELLPQDGNHLGVSPNPDFVLAIPVSEESNPVQPLVLKKVVAMSARSTGGSHPAVIALDNAGEPGTLTKTDNGVVFTVTIPAGAKTEKLGICLNCSAPQ